MSIYDLSGAAIIIDARTPPRIAIGACWCAPTYFATCCGTASGGKRLAVPAVWRAKSVRPRDEVEQTGQRSAGAAIRETQRHRTLKKLSASCG
jgi:hypothetical protein